MYKPRMEQMIFVAVLLGAALISVAVSYAAWPVVVALLIMPIAMLWPLEVALGLFALLVPFESILLLGKSGTTLNWIVGAGAGAILAATGLATGRLERPVPSTLWWTGFVSWSLFTVFWAYDPLEAKARVPTALALFMLYLVVSCYRVSRRELSFVFLMIIFGGGGAAGYSVWQYVNGIHGIGAYGSYAVRATLVGDDRFANPNFFAASLLLPMSLAFSQFLTRRKILTRVFMLGVIGVIGLAILLTMSRGVLVATFAMLVVYLYRFRVNIRTLIPIALIVLLLFAVPDLFFTRFQQSVASHAEGRFDIWRVGVEALKHYGFLGAGLGNFPSVYDQFSGVGSRYMFAHRSPHNVYLGVWVETGIVGLALFLAAFGTQLRHLSALVKAPGQLAFAEMVACEAAAFGILVHCVVAELQWTKSFWQLSFLLAIMIRLQRATAVEKAIPASFAHPIPAAGNYFQQVSRVGRF